MKTSKALMDSLLSACCVICWFYLAIKIITSFSDDFVIERIVWTNFITTIAGILAGAVLLLKGALNKGNFKFSFIYNFLATMNIMVGIFGMLFYTGEGRPDFLAAICFCIGIVMYKTIYRVVS